MKDDYVTSASLVAASQDSAQSQGGDEQMAQVTADMIASIIAHAENGERYPLTANELRQLAYMAQSANTITASAASEVTPNLDTQGMVLEKPSEDTVGYIQRLADAMAVHMYVNDYGEWVLPKNFGLDSLVRRALTAASSPSQEPEGSR